VERWQIGGIFNMFVGEPITFGSNSSTFNNETDGTSNQLGDIPKTGTITRVSDGVVFYPGLRQVRDPGTDAITTAQGLQARSTLFAIADSSGRIIMSNPAPGQIGTMGYRTIFGPGSFTFDANLVKRVRIGEGKEFEFRIDAIDVLNTPRFGNPEVGINSTTTPFGRITSADGNRILVLNARINF
jgi:hypothetical protein